MKNWEQSGLKRAFLTILLALIANGIAITDEIFNATITSEYFEEDRGASTWAFIGVDTTGDGFTDIFIFVRPLEYMPARRTANVLKNAKTVSFEDSTKEFSNRLGADYLNNSFLFEINGKSILEIFPGREDQFQYAAERQKRLNGGR
jgi:hypothetical protein